MSDALDLASLIREGDTITWGSASAEPVHLLQLFQDAVPRMPRASIFIAFGLSGLPDPAIVAPHLRVKALGGAGVNRRYQELGNFEVLPAHYSRLPDMIARGELPIDVLLLQLASEGGRNSVAIMADHIPDAIARARVVVAEVNDQAPVTYGDVDVAPGDIDHIIHVSHPIPEVASRKSGQIERTIGEHVARLIGDGATLQVGIGALPDAVLECLGSKRDLGLHSGTIGDRVVDLVEAGALTNRRKTIDTGKCIAAGLIGTKRLYQWAHRNRDLVMRSTRYTHDNAVHSQINDLIGINTALEVDLTGQMNAELAGSRHVGLVGGHADFMRGCQRSPGGRGIVAMEATAKGGTLSRIVPRLAGGVVTTSRADADVVVTEYGVAELRGRTVKERATALIAVAHPDFRKALQAETERLV
jgi:acyl-CoA hydrolase